MTLTDLFGRIYIINLPHRIDRREATVKELQAIDIHVELGKVEFFPAIRPKNPEPFHNLGTKGCFLSMLCALKRSQEIGSGHVLIVEDDIKFPDFFQEKIGSLLEKLNEQRWDIAQFGYLKIEDANPTDLDAPFGTWKDMSNAIIGAHLFGVNGQSIDRYIHFMESLLTRPRDHPKGGPMPADGALTVFRQLNPDVVRLIALPSFADQRSSRSDISPSWFDKVPVMSTLAAFYRQKIKE